MRAFISNILPIGKKVSGDEFDKEIPALIGRAKNHVMWSTALYPTFFNSAKVKENIHNAVDRGVYFKILIGPPGRPLNKIPWLYELKKERSNVEVRKTTQRIRHVVYVDGKHVRIEDPHPDREKGEWNVIIYNTCIARSGERDFNSVWDTAEEVDNNESDPV